MPSVSFDIQPLTLADLTAMTQIENQAHAHPWSEANIQDCFNPLYRIVGLKQTVDVKQDTALLGFAIVQQILDEATLHDICVSPNAQGQGLGKRLLTYIIEQAKEAGAVVMMLEVRASNHAALALYERLGFTESGRRKGYYPTVDGREDAILMDLVLSHH